MTLSTTDKLLNILSEETGTQITEEMKGRMTHILTGPLKETLQREFGTDSLDDVELIMAIEEEWGEDVDDAVCESWRNLQDVINWLDK